MATNNFALAICALLIIPYTIYVEELKSLLIRDMHCSVLGLHGIFCIIWNKFEINVLFMLFVAVVGGISAIIG